MWKHFKMGVVCKLWNVVSGNDDDDDDDGDGDEDDHDDESALW